MPNFSFDTRFLKRNHSIEPVNTQQISALYNGEPPIYFEATGDPDTNAQLQAFKASPSYPSFQHQYERLLVDIKKWCVANNVPVTRVRTDDPQGISAIRLFYYRLFTAEDFFSIRAALLFDEGKKSLEELYILLLDERISLDNKKNVLMNFQEGIVVCGDGTLTNIIDAKDDLKAATGLEQTIESAKRKLLQQQILNFIKLKRINIKAGNEIHLVNAFYDLVADSYGVPKRNDNVKTPGAEKYVNELVTYLNSQLTPQVVIRYLTEQMNLDLKFAQETLFKGKEAVEWSADFIVQAEKLIKAFNDRYSPLMTIDMHSIIQSDDDGLRLTPKPINETWLQATTIRQFYKLFCIANATPHMLTVADGPRTLKYSESFIWMEENSEIISCTPQQFFAPYLRTNKPFTLEHFQRLSGLKTHGVELLNQLWTHYPNYKNELLQCLRDPDVDVAYLLSSSNVELIEEIIRNQLQPQKAFSFIVDMEVLRSLHTAGKFDVLKQLGQWGIIDTYKLAKNKEYALLNSLLQHDVLVQNHFLYPPYYVLTAYYKDVNIIGTIRLLVSEQQFDLIGKLSDKGLITEAALLYTSSLFRGSALSTLYAQKKIELIKQLFRNKAITSTQLAADNQWEILASLIAENAIRSEHLSDKIGSGTNYQKNTVFILILNNQKDLFLKLLDQQLLKTEHFMAKAGSGIYKGKTALDLLFKAEELDLIKSLLERKAISVLELAEKKEFPALAKLIELQLLTAEDLNEEVRTQRETKSLLNFLVKHKQFELLHKLADQGLLTEEHLSRRVEPSKYLEQLLNENQQQSLVKHIRNAAETASAPERMDVDFDFENPPNRPKRKEGEDLEQAFPVEAPAAKKRRSSAITFFSEAPEPDENDSLSNTLPNVNKTGRS